MEFEQRPDLSRPEVIFSTIHGSHLYGMAHKDSDMDRFTVTTGRRTRARHNMNRETNVDTCTIGIDVYLRRIFEGSHQSVEALFSPYKEWNDDSYTGRLMRPYLESMYVTGSAVFAKYERTIKSFCFGDFKRRRHAARLALNLADLRAHGRFNPVMTESQIQYAGLAAERLEGDRLWHYLT